VTGEPGDLDEYRALNPHGRAMLKAAPYLPPDEEPDADHPFRLNTGRTLFHFHTRTKTGRAPELQEAAPEPWVELSVADASRLGISEGDLVEVVSARGAVKAPARITDIREGVLFVPFHYGYWDASDGHTRAANELTITEWDPASKQPLFKSGAASVRRLAGRDAPAPAPSVTASAPARGVRSDGRARVFL
jgi:anaerobic selenocysteine-containing dehydrogenase